MGYLYSINSPAIKGASKELLGGKGYGLWRMKQAGINVPPAYIITTDACRAYMQDPENVMAEVKSQIIPEIRKGLKKEFGYEPLVSVRSGARDSMPGMMDTVLNVGLSKANMAEWDSRLGIECVEDSFERLIEMYGNVVKGIERKKFESKKGIEERLLFYKLEVGQDFPGAADQLVEAIEAVFKSWNNARAKTYRELNDIPDDLGTAVVIQAMVFGNMNDKSGTGVAFSRNYSNGTNEVVGDFLVNGQGEDVVAGIRTPAPLSSILGWNDSVAEELMKTIYALEKTERDMVDVEFTVQDGVLYILQVRAGKRTAQAAVRIAVDLVDEKLISPEEALDRVTLKQFLGATRPVVSATWVAKNPPHAVGLPASNGCVTGVAVFSSAAAIASKEPCILIAEETTPDDIGGMNAAQGILTSTGGATSHAAVVARGMDKVCVVGCMALKRVGAGWFLGDLGEEKRGAQRIIKEGDKVTIDGNSGAVWVNADVPIEGGVANGTATRFLALLETRFAFYRTVTSVEQMAGADKLLVATYPLDRLDASKLEFEFDSLLMAIDGRESVIDLRSFSDFVRPADAPLEYMFGERVTDATARKVAVLCGFAGKKELKNACVLELGLDKKQIQDLKEAGVQFIPAVKNISSLLAANGLCTADFDALLQTMSREDVNRILALKKASGEKVRSFNIVDAVDPEAMSRSALFALSPMQAAQSFLKGSK